MKNAMLLFLVKHDGIYRSEFLTRFGGNDNYQVFTELLQDGYLRLEGCIESFPYDGLTWDSVEFSQPMGQKKYCPISLTGMPSSSQQRLI